MVFRDEKELLDICEEFKDQGTAQANIAYLGQVMQMIEDFLNEKLLAADPSFDHESPHSQL